MLYVTTRNDLDAVTSHRVLTEDRAEDGGFYVPLRHPVFSHEELDKLTAMPFSQRMAEVLNVLFQTKLTRWDVEFSIGRSAVKLVPLRHRIVMGEFWHNPDWCFRKMEHSLANLLGSHIPGSWLRIAIRAAVLAAVSLELSEEGGEVDVSAVSGDFLWPVSAWYARRWGFPVGSIIMCCNENKSIWELICHGQLRTDAVGISTELPEADIAIPAELERLIYGCGGLPAPRDLLFRGGTDAFRTAGGKLCQRGQQPSDPGYSHGRSGYPQLSSDPCIRSGLRRSAGLPGKKGDPSDIAGDL